MELEALGEKLVSLFIGNKHERDIRRIRPLVDAINALEPELQQLTDAELRARTDRFREQIRSRMEQVPSDSPDWMRQLQQALDEVLVPAFATVREAARRKLNMRHFDVQLIGGIVLHQGKIAEMKTGEGKTLVATLPAYLNALAGYGVHIVTVNDYLARRDAEWMAPIYRSLGLSVGVITHDLDDARTPLIISGPAEESTEKYYRIDKIIPRLIRDIDYTVDEKFRTVTLTEEGVSKCERLLGIQNLYDPVHIETLHHIYQALRAHALFKRDVDYVVKNGQVIIIDEFTGREMPGRRWSDGLHQAIEAKEGVKIERENQTLATITFQNYFRMYRKL